VFPLLLENKVQGLFFPPAGPARDGRTLDVNKIHFVLAACEDKRLIISAIFQFLDKNREAFGLADNRDYYSEHAVANRFDIEEVVFIKRMLQKVLPEPLRNKIVDDLFKTFVTADERAFAAELYMSADQLRVMVENGMYIGSHGYDHYWLDSLASPIQTEEITKSLAFLAEIGATVDKWLFCYPYGAYDDSLLGILRDKGCIGGFTTRVGIANLARDEPLLLPRLDTNDMPKSGRAEPNHWTRAVLSA